MIQDMRGTFKLIVLAVASLAPGVALADNAAAEAVFGGIAALFVGIVAFCLIISIVMLCVSSRVPLVAIIVASIVGIISFKFMYWEWDIFNVLLNLCLLLCALTVGRGLFTLRKRAKTGGNATSGGSRARRIAWSTALLVGLVAVLWFLAVNGRQFTTEFEGRLARIQCWDEYKTGREGHEGGSNCYLVITTKDREQVNFPVEGSSVEELKGCVGQTILKKRYAFSPTCPGNFRW